MFDIESFDFADWPETPQSKRIYHNGLIDNKNAALLAKKNWIVVDVRLLPSASDSERADALKAWLEGIRFGTIEIDKDQLQSFQLEAKIYGLINQRNSTSTGEKLDKATKQTLDSLFDFGRGKDHLASAADKTKAQNKRRTRGRPKKEEE